MFNFFKKDKNGKNFSFKMHFNKLGGHLFGRVQNLSRAIVLPIAVLPIAGLLLGIGGGLASALSNTTVTHGANLTWLVNIFKVMQNAGQFVFSNLGAIFAIAIAFGFAKASKGVAALSGFLAFGIMEAVISILFFPTGAGAAMHATFDPWNLAGGKPFSDISNAQSGIFASILGISNTFDTSVLGGILTGWIVAVVHNHSYNIKMPKALAFFAGERFVPILAVFLGIGLGVVFFFLWPALLKGFQGLGHVMGSAMGTKEAYVVNGKLTGSDFHPTVAGAFISMFFGITERLLVPTGLHHVQYTPFWYTAAGGTWHDPAAKEPIIGAYTIFFAQFASPYTGHMNQFPGTIFLSGRFAFMQYGYPFAALAMWMLAKPENKKLVAGILGSGALTSFLTGITEPILFSYIFAAPLCFVWHAFLAGISFMMAYCLNVVVGQGFAAGFIDFCFFGILPDILGKGTGFYWIFLIGLVMAPAYFFGFYYIIKWKNYKTLGREDGAMASNIAFQTVEASLNKTTKKAKSKAYNLLTGLGGVSNIKDIIAEGQFLVVTLGTNKDIAEGLIRLSGTKTIKKEDENKVRITYLEGANKMYEQLQEEIKNAQSSGVGGQASAGNGKTERLEMIFKGLGGRTNIKVLDNCATRLRVTVVDLSLVDDTILKQTGAVAVVKKGDGVQVIYGLEVANIKNDLVNIWKS